MSNNDIFWIDNIMILFDNKELTSFLPSNNMTLNQKLNSIVRFCLYLSILLIFLKRNYLYFYIFIFSLFITYFIYYFENEKKNDDNKYENENIFFIEKNNNPIANKFVKKNKKKKCIKPTYNNPFMNYNILTDKTNREPACKSYNNYEIQEKIEDDFNVNLYKNIGDVFNKNNSQREYYTMPVTQSSNKQKEFAEWLYNTGPTCKDGNGNQCVKNNSNRLEIP